MTPKSKIGVALEYLHSNWTALNNYLLDGRILDITNNGAERALRRVAVGRKNWCAGQSSDKENGRSYGSSKPCLGPSGCKPRPAKVDHQPEPSDAWCWGDPRCEAFTGSLQAV